MYIKSFFILNVVILFLVPSALGYVIRDLKCSSYNSLLDKYTQCVTLNITTEDMAKVQEMTRDQLLTKTEAIDMLKTFCRVRNFSESEKRCIKIGCVSDSEMEDILNKLGGICDGNGNVEQQGFQLFTNFESLNLTDTCSKRRGDQLSLYCNITRPSDITYTLDPSVNIYDGIKQIEAPENHSLHAELMP